MKIIADIDDKEDSFEESIESEAELKKDQKFQIDQKKSLKTKTKMTIR